MLVLWHCHGHYQAHKAHLVYQPFPDLSETGQKYFILFRNIHISYFKHNYTRYKFNEYIVLHFGSVQIKAPNKLFTNELDKNIYI